MDNFKEWVKDNRILVGAVVVLTLILIVLLTFNQAKTPMERGLEADSAKTQQIQEQKEDTQKEQEQSQKFSETIRTDEADFIKHCKESQKKYSYMLDPESNLESKMANTRKDNIESLI